jgi:hypothetical protein
MDWKIGVITEWELGNLGGGGRSHCDSFFKLFPVEFAHEAVVVVPWHPLRWGRRGWAVMAAESISPGCILSTPFTALFVSQFR